MYFLAAPDAFAAPSVIPLAASHPEVVIRALKLKKIGNVICEAVGRSARTPHLAWCPAG